MFKDSEKTVDTASNLRFQVLESIAASLCLNIASLAPWKSHLNALVDLRNNIAHGSRPTTLTVVDFDRLATNTIGMMEEFEKVVIFSLHTRSFCGQAA